jgi:hypothetical protein
MTSIFQSLPSHRYNLARGDDAWIDEVLLVLHFCIFLPIYLVFAACSDSTSKALGKFSSYAHHSGFLGQREAFWVTFSSFNQRTLIFSYYCKGWCCMSVFCIASAWLYPLLLPDQHCDGRPRYNVQYRSLFVLK